MPPKHDLLNGACNLGLACCLANYTFQAAATVNSRVILFVYLCKNSAPLSLGQRQSHNAHFCVCAGGGVGSFVNAREVRCIPIVQSHGHEVQTAAEATQSRLSDQLNWRRRCHYVWLKQFTNHLFNNASRACRFLSLCGCATKAHFSCFFRGKNGK